MGVDSHGNPQMDKTEMRFSSLVEQWESLFSKRTGTLERSTSLPGKHLRSRRFVFVEAQEGGGMVKGGGNLLLFVGVVERGGE